MTNFFTNKSTIKLYYFSGTGNTQIICNRLSAKFKEYGYPVNSNRMEENCSISINGNDIIGLGFPIASFSTYPLVFDFLDRLPVVNNIPVFGFCTMGGASLLGIIDEVRAILLRKGYISIGFNEFAMPPNIFIKLHENMRKSRIERGLQKADRFAKMLTEGTTNWNKKLIGSKVIFLLASGLFKLAELQVHQKFLKIRVDHDKCNRCGFCVKKCPAHNIFQEDKIVIGNKCQYCFRCVAVCPKEATFGVLTPKSLHYRAEYSDL